MTLSLSSVNWWMKSNILDVSVVVSVSFLLTIWGILISYCLRLARPCDMRGERNPPKRAAMKAVKMRGKVKTASPCLSSEKTGMRRGEN